MELPAPGTLSPCPTRVGLPAGACARPEPAGVFMPNLFLAMSFVTMIMQFNGTLHKAMIYEFQKEIYCVYRKIVKMKNISKLAISKMTKHNWDGGEV